MIESRPDAMNYSDFRRGVACVVLLVTAAVFVNAEENKTGSDRPGFATCAAYYFLAARGHGVKDYDRLYSSGEYSLNHASERHGKQAATTKMETASGAMMDEMHQDWREIATLDGYYLVSCESLLRDAGFRYE